MLRRCYATVQALARRAVWQQCEGHTVLEASLNTARAINNSSAVKQSQKWLLPTALLMTALP